MGCACVTKIKEIYPKDIDLTEEQTNTHLNEISNEISNINISKKTMDKIIKVKKCDLMNQKEINNSNNKKKKCKSNKSIIINNSTHYDYSGPIITLLKSRVENYHKKKFKY